MSTPHDIPGWPRDEQAVAWLRAWLRGQRTGDERLVERASAELRALGVAVSVCSVGAP